MSPSNRPYISHARSFLAYIRKELGYTQAQFGEVLNVSRTWVATLEAGRHDHTPKVLTKYSDYLGIRNFELMELKYMYPNLSTEQDTFLQGLLRKKKGGNE